MSCGKREWLKLRSALNLAGDVTSIRPAYVLDSQALIRSFKCHFDIGD
jgi:hypothetical protein